jgi:hypothetical protein
MNPWIIPLLLLIVFLAAKLLEKRQASGSRPGAATDDPLDRAVLPLSARDTLTLRDLLNGGVAIFGRTGSGKSSSSGFVLGNGLVRCAGTGGLILASKPEDKAFWEKIFVDAGRGDDLVVFEPDSHWRYNLLDSELRSGADTRELTQMIVTISETLKRNSNSRGGENDAFWEQLKERTIYNAIEIVKKATGGLTAEDLQQFIVNAATSPDEMNKPAWQTGFHNRCLEMAFYAHKTPAEEHDFRLAFDFWLKEYPVMDQKPRSASLADVLGVLHVFCSGIVKRLLSEKTNVSPAVLERGKWILVDMPIPVHGAAGAFVNGAMKYAVQRHVLRRHALRGAHPIVIWCDEFQNYVNHFDGAFLAECRSHRGFMVILTQSIHSFYGSMGGQNGKHRADALLTNFAALKVFHALGDEQTASYASSLIGKSLQGFFGSSMAPMDSVGSEMTGDSKLTTNMSERLELTLQPSVFMNGLRTGGVENGLVCDAVVIRSGVPFADGNSWLRCAFSQE